MKKKKLKKLITKLIEQSYLPTNHSTVWDNGYYVGWKSALATLAEKAKVD